MKAILALFVCYFSGAIVAGILGFPPYVVVLWPIAATIATLAWGIAALVYVVVGVLVLYAVARLIERTIEWTRKS
jgi:hypothetical protein